MAKQGFNFSKHMPQHMAHGSRANTAQGKHEFNFYKHMRHMAHGTWQTRPRANMYLTFTNTYHSPWHMAASRATGKKGFNFYNHVP